MSLSTTIKSIQDIMRKDVGVDGEVWAGEVEEQHARDCLGPCRGE